jgi:hypothetical protein
LRAKNRGGEQNWLCKKVKFLPMWFFEEGKKWGDKERILDENAKFDV